MKTHSLVQGSPEWAAHRRNHFNASDAPAMMGCSPYTTRSALIKRLATGIEPEVPAALQNIFNAGHEFERLARPLAEEIIGDDLYPITATEGKYSASFDGLTFDKLVAFEHKTLNQSIRDSVEDTEEVLAIVAGSNFPEHYRVQMEHQMMVSGSERTLFLATCWDGGNLTEARKAWYLPDVALRERIVAGWAQLELDVAAYVPSEEVAPVVAKPAQGLPSVVVRVEGALAVKSNLPEIATALRAFIDGMVAKPATDQEFADADAECKALKKIEDALDLAEDNALAQLVDVDTFRRMKAEMRELARSTRLRREKLVAAEKENRRTTIVSDAARLLMAHVAALNVRLGKPYMPEQYGRADFGAAIKGMKNLDKMQDAVDTRLAQSKLEANAAADAIQANLETLRTMAADHSFLFRDAPTLVLKSNEDVVAQVKTRIAEHDAAEKKKNDEQREKIRQEEEAKAQEKVRQENEQRQKDARMGEAIMAMPSDFDKYQSEIDVQAAELAPLQPGYSRQPIDAFVGAAETPPETGAATLLIGQINAAFGVGVTGAFLETLGFKPAKVEGPKKLYLDSDFERIRAALIRHIGQAKRAS